MSTFNQLLFAANVGFAVWHAIGRREGWAAMSASAAAFQFAVALLH